MALRETLIVGLNDDEVVKGIKGLDSLIERAFEAQGKAIEEMMGGSGQKAARKLLDELGRELRAKKAKAQIQVEAATDRKAAETTRRAAVAEAVEARNNRLRAAMAELTKLGREGTQEYLTLASAIKRVPAPRVPKPQGARAAGKRTGDEFADGLERALALRMARIEQQVAKGLIGADEAGAARAAAIKQHNAAIVTEVDRRRDAGSLTDTQELALSGALRQIPPEAEQAKAALDDLATWVKGYFITQIASASAQVLGALRTWATESIGAAREVMQSTLRLGTAPKLFGVSARQVADIARYARGELKLMGTVANDLTVSVVKMAAQAGNAAKAQTLLNSALDLGAAQGLSAAEVNVALEQTLRGMDEGTDKLLQKNPSDIYKEFAKEVGKSAEKLTAAEQKQALMNAIIAAGTKVTGTYSSQLNENLGRLNAWELGVREAKETVGSAMIPVVVSLADRLAGPLSTAVQNLTTFFDSLADPMDVAIRKMREMGAEAELTIPLLLQQQIARGHAETTRLRAEILTERTGITPGRNGYNEFVGVRTRVDTRSVAELEEAVRGLTKDRNDAIVSGDTRAATAAQNRISNLQLIITKEQQLAALERDVADAGRKLEGARAQADKAARIAAIDLRIEQIGLEGESLARIAETNRLLEEKARLERELGRNAPAAPPSTASEPDKLKAGALNARAELEQLSEELALVRKLADLSGGANWRLLTDIPGAAGEAAREVKSLTDEIQRLQRQERTSKTDSASVDVQVGVLAVRRDTAQRRAEVLAGLEAAYQRQIGEIAVAQLNGRMTKDEAGLAGEEAGVRFNLGLAAAVADLPKELQPQLAAAAKEVEMPMPEINMEPLLRGISGDLRPLARVREEVDAAVRRVQLAKAQADAARNSGEYAAARARLDAEQARLAATLSALSPQMDSLGLSEEKLLELTQWLAQAFGEAGLGAGAFEDGLDGLAGKAELIEGLARAFLSVADAAGRMGDSMRSILTGVTDLASGVAAVGRARKAMEESKAKNGGKASTDSVLAYAGAAATAIGGAVSILQGIFQRDEAARLRQIVATAQNTRALEAFRRNAINSVSADDRAEMAEVGEQVLELIATLSGAIGGTPARINMESVTAEQVAFLTRLEEITGAEFFDESTGQLLTAEFRRAFEAFLAGDLGSFGNDVSGRIEAVEFVLGALGEAAGDVAAKVELLLEALRSADQVPEEFVAGLEQVLEDGGAEAALAWLQQLAAAFAAGGAQNPLIAATFGEGFSAEEIQRMLEQAIRIVSSGETSGSSKSASVANSITEVQAVEVIAWLEDIALSARKVVDLLGGGGEAPAVPGDTALSAASASAGGAWLDPATLARMSASTERIEAMLAQVAASSLSAPDPAGSMVAGVRTLRGGEGGVHLDFRGADFSGVSPEQVRQQIRDAFREAGDRLAWRRRQSGGGW